MRVIVVVRDLVEVFAGNAEPHWDVVVTRRQDELAPAMATALARPCRCSHDEVAVDTFEVVYTLVLAHFEPVMQGHAAIVFERLGTVGLLAHARHRQIANLEQLRRREERQVVRIVVERVDQAPFLDHQRIEPAPFQLDRARQPGRPGADDHGVMDPLLSPVPCPLFLHPLIMTAAFGIDRLDSHAEPPAVQPDRQLVARLDL